MCGITAISRALVSSIPDPRQFMRLAALAIEPRGKDATGFAWVQSNGKGFYWKDGQRAQDAVTRAPLDYDIRTAIGHTRFGTQGKASDNRNNHPVIDDGVMLVHNGIIDNDWELYDWLGKDYIPKAEVDSQVIATMLANPDAFHARNTCDLLELLEGDAALAWIETATPDVLHLARVQGRPLTLGWTRKGDLVMSSTPETLKNLSVWSNVKVRDVWRVPEGTYLTVRAGEVTMTQTFKPMVRKPKHNYTSSYTGQTLMSHSKPTTPTTTSSGGGAVVPFDSRSPWEQELDDWWAEQEERERAELDAIADPGDELTLAERRDSGRWTDPHGIEWVPIFDGDEIVDYVLIDEHGYFIGLANSDFGMTDYTIDEEVDA